MTIPNFDDSADGYSDESTVVEISNGAQYMLTDNSLIDYFMHTRGKDWRHNLALGWLRWTGTHWERDESNHLRHELLLMIRSLPKSKAWLRGRRDETKRRELMKFAQGAESVKLNSIVKLADRPELSVENSKLDVEKSLLPCLNGTVDLLTGRLVESKREHYFTRCVPLAYDPAARCPVFDSFMQDIIPEHADRVWMQQILGSCTMGRLAAQEFYVFSGSGSNGKGTLFRALTATLGKFLASPPSSLVVGGSGGGESPTPVLLMLRGARGVFMSEPKTGAPLNNEMLKTWSGEDAQTARDLHGKPITFTLEAAPFIATNSIPRIDKIDNGIIRRIRVYNFPKTFYPKAERRRGESFEDRILAEREGILAWLIRGAVMNELFNPVITPTVSELTREVVAGQDELGSFIKEECVIDSTAKIGAGVLKDAYVSWRGTDTRMSVKSFTQQLRNRPGIITGPNAGTVHGKKAAVCGITLRMDHPHWDQSAASVWGKSADLVDLSNRPTQAMSGGESDSEVIERFLGSDPETVRKIGALADLLNAEGADWSTLADDYASGTLTVTPAVAAPVATVPVAATEPVVPAAVSLSYQCKTLAKRGGHAECKRNRAKGARLAVACGCECHIEGNGDDRTVTPLPVVDTAATEKGTATAPATGPSAPTTGPSAPTTGPSAPTAGPSAPTAGPSAPTAGPSAPTAGPTARKRNSGNGFREDSAIPAASKRRAGKFTTETAAYVDVAAGKGVTSDDRTFSYRKTKSGPTLARLLGSIPEGVRHVHLTGIVPGETPEGFRTWAQGQLPEGWQVGDRGIMFDARRPDRATLHYTRPEGDPLTVYRAAGWVGIDLEETTSAAELREAFELLRAGLQATFTIATKDDRGVPIKATPGATGIELVWRTLPAGKKNEPPKEYPLLSEADQSVLRSYAGQGRQEDYSLTTHPTGGVNIPDTIPGLYIADMRWAFNKALDLEMPIGELSKDTEPYFLYRDDIERTGFLPCWYRVRVTVPNDWNRHGLFGFRDETRNGQWAYPSEPGTTFETWAWDRTLALGEKHGWTIGENAAVQILERWKFDATRRNEKPLVTFGKHIRTLRQEWLPEQSASRTVKALVSAMARNICIAAIGSMLGKRYESYRTESDLSKVAELPDTAVLTEDGKRYEWFEASSAAGSLSHPEWVSYIYAATRDRLFDHPTQKGIGIAHVDKSVLLTVHTDSLWTTEPIGVEDTGKVGDFRVQTAHDGELPTPRTYAELMRLRNELDQEGE